MEPDRLSSYPFVIVRIGCSLCGRNGAYRLARLAAKYGPEIPLDQLLEELALDCPWRRGRSRRAPGKDDPNAGLGSSILMDRRGHLICRQRSRDCG
jgi:hypothetical protein